MVASEQLVWREGESQSATERASDDISSPLLHEDHVTLALGHFEKRVHISQRRVSLFLLVANVIWTLALLFISAVLWSHSCLSPWQLNRLNADLRWSSIPSPLFDKVDLGLRTRKTEGSIHDNGSIFRQPPSDAVDDAWASLALEGSELINVTAADIRNAGQDPSTKVRWDESIDAYPAQVEFAHKIHCLNEIRKEIWGEHYFGNLSIHASDASDQREEQEPSGFGPGVHPSITTLNGARQMHRQHTMHCLHIILQDLTCNVDVGIITHDWVPVPGMPDEPPVPLADFSNNQRCRDFDAALNWARSNAVADGEAKYSKLQPPKDVKVANANDSYWKA